MAIVANRQKMVVWRVREKTNQEKNDWVSKTRRCIPEEATCDLYAYEEDVGTWSSNGGNAAASGST